MGRQGLRHAAWVVGAVALIATPAVFGVEGDAGAGIVCAEVGTVGPAPCELWSAFYNGPADFRDVLRGLAVNPDGSRVYLGGESYVSGLYGTEGADSDLTIVALDAATGDQLWAVRYGQSTSSLNRLVGLAVSPDGTRIYATGLNWTSQQRIPTLALDAMTGDIVWVAQYVGPAGDASAEGMSLSPDGQRLFVTGFQWMGLDAKTDFLTIAYNATTGAQEWVATYGKEPIGAAFDLGQLAAVSPDSARVFVAGSSFGSATDTDFATVAYDAATGAQLWVGRYAGAARAQDFPQGIAMAPDGTRVFVTGYTASPGDVYDATTVAYDSFTGAQAWKATYNGPAGRTDRAFSVETSPDGFRVFVAGMSRSWAQPAWSWDYATIAYDAATGTQAWVATYGGLTARDDVASDLLVTPDGSRVYTAGQSWGAASKEDFLLVSNDAGTGERESVVRFNGPQNDSDLMWLRADGRHLVSSPDGSRLYLAGTVNGDFFFGNCPRCDFAVVAYAIGSEG